MHYITDYQLDINRGFQCKVNGKAFNCTFNLNSLNKQYFITNILSVADAIGIPRQEFIDVFNSSYISNSIYCISKQQCYDLCQHIVATYFKPINVSYIKECCEKSREHLKHYYHGTEQVNFPNGTFILKQCRAREYFWSGTNPNIGSKDIYMQFKLSLDQILRICDNLKLHAYFAVPTLLFGSREDAIKFADYLIETYIIKKEKTYDTNQLRKERTSIRRGVEPAGRIIHGRRSKASVRCRHIEHKACVGG